MTSHLESILSKHRIIPVIHVSKLDHIKPITDELAAGGLPLAEITLRSKCSIDAINKLAQVEHFLVGAGTVLNELQCQRAVNAGARFIVSPGLDEGVVRYCQQHNIACYPGVATATELQRAYNLGVRTVKFFPAECLGGVSTLKALAAPFPKMKFIPTGGISPQNLRDYLELPATLAAGGSWLTRESWFAGGDFSRVSQAAHQAVSMVSAIPHDNR